MEKITPQEFAQRFALVTDDYEVMTLAAQIARRIAAAEIKKQQNLSWSTARRLASSASASQELLCVVKDTLASGGSYIQATNAGLKLGFEQAIHNA